MPQEHWDESSRTLKSQAILYQKPALFISVGATKGKRLFDGSLLTMRYFLETLDADLWETLLYRQLDFETDILKHPQYLEEAYQTGKRLVEEIYTHSKSELS